MKDIKMKTNRRGGERRKEIKWKLHCNLGKRRREKGEREGGKQTVMKGRKLKRNRSGSGGGREAVKRRIKEMFSWTEEKEIERIKGGEKKMKEN